MGFKLVRVFFVGTILLTGLNGTAIGGECESVLNRMQDVFDKMKGGDEAAGVVPESLLQLPYDEKISIIEDSNTPEKIAINDTGYCFKFSGDWSQDPNTYKKIKVGNIEYNFPPTTAYVFFKNPSVDKIGKNLFVNSLDKKDGKGNRLIALNAIHTDKNKKKTFAGSAPNDRPEDLKEKIIWLHLDSNTRKNNSNEVVLCEAPCRDILTYYQDPITNEERTEADGEVVTESSTGGNPTEAGNGKKGSETAEQKNHTGELEKLKDLLESAQQELKDTNEEKKKLTKELQDMKNAIPDLMVSEISLKFVNNQGEKLKNIRKNNLITQECLPPKEVKRKWTLKSLSTFFYKNCISISGYEILNVKPAIQSEKIPVLTFTLKKHKPDTFTAIQVPVEMKGGSKITNACILTAKIIDNNSNEEIFEGAFESINNSPTNHTFSLILNKSINPIAWEGKTLVLERYEGEDGEPDCQPEGGELRVQLTEKEITYDGVLKLQRRTVLDSTLSNALLMLNTMIGVKPDGSASSIEFYPIEDNESTKNIYRKIVTQFLNNLHGKVDGFTVGFSKPHGKVELKTYPGNIEKTQLPAIAAEIVDRAVFIDDNFIWNSMSKKIDREIKKSGPGNYKYRIFIGQSGLHDKKSYCDNNPRKDALKEQKVATFIYDFATIGNTDNPLESDLTGVLSTFPHKQCDDKYRHIVLFPKAKKGGWENAISILLSTAFKSVRQ